MAGWSLQWGYANIIGKSLTVAVHALQVDVVYIGNLHLQHKSAALLMIAAGKHVLCEKPLSMCSKDTADIIAAARSKKVFLMEVILLF